jgi:hypothetical protein
VQGWSSSPSFDTGDIFGKSIAPLGDLNRDGVLDIIVAASMDDDGGTDRGAVYIMYLNSDGTVHTYQKISSLEVRLTLTLNPTPYTLNPKP